MTAAIQMATLAVAVVALVFAARSANASHRSAEQSELVRRRDEAELARRARPDVVVREKAWFDVSTGKARIYVDNAHALNDAEDVDVVVPRGDGAAPDVAAREWAVARSHSALVMIDLAPAPWQQDETGRRRTMVGLVVEFSDAFGLGRWRRYAQLYVNVAAASERSAVEAFVLGLGPATEIRDVTPAAAEAWSGRLLTRRVRGRSPTRRPGPAARSA